MDQQLVLQEDSNNTGKKRQKLVGFRRFLGCFCGVGQNHNFLPPKKPKSMGKSQWFSLSRIKSKRKSVKRTFNIATIIDEKTLKIKKHKQYSFSLQLPAKEVEDQRIPAPEKVHRDHKTNIKIKEGKESSNDSRKKNATCTHQHRTCKNPVMMKSQSQKRHGGLDQVVIIITVGLIIIMMMIWGKLYAIICTCACFYIHPLLITPKINQHNIVVKPKSCTGGDEHDLNNINVNSNMLQLVFKGFLERN